MIIYHYNATNTDNTTKNTNLLLILFLIPILLLGKRDKDMAFFTIASEEFGFIVSKEGQEQRQSYPFVENDGRDVERGIVYIYKLTIS